MEIDEIRQVISTGNKELAARLMSAATNFTFVRMLPEFREKFGVHPFTICDPGCNCCGSCSALNCTCDH